MDAPNHHNSASLIAAQTIVSGIRGGPLNKPANLTEAMAVANSGISTRYPKYMAGQPFDGPDRRFAHYVYAPYARRDGTGGIVKLLYTSFPIYGTGTTYLNDVGGYVYYDSLLADEHENLEPAFRYVAWPCFITAVVSDGGRGVAEGPSVALALVALAFGAPPACYTGDTDGFDVSPVGEVDIKLEAWRETLNSGHAETMAAFPFFVGSWPPNKTVDIDAWVGHHKYSGFFDSGLLYKAGAEVVPTVVHARSALITFAGLARFAGTMLVQQQNAPDAERARAKAENLVKISRGIWSSDNVDDQTFTVPISYTDGAREYELKLHPYGDWLSEIMGAAPDAKEAAIDSVASGVNAAIGKESSTAIQMILTPFLTGAATKARNIAMQAPAGGGPKGTAFVGTGQKIPQVAAGKKTAQQKLADRVQAAKRLLNVA